MYPACIATAALVAAGATSTGGLIALVVMKLPARTGEKSIDPKSEKGGAHDESSKNRVAR